MERLDFASVMAVLRRNVSEVLWPGQSAFVHMLFRDAVDEITLGAGFDEGLVSRWINGFAPVSPNIVAYYLESINQKKLYVTIEDVILPMIPDGAKAVQELQNLLIYAQNITDRKSARRLDRRHLSADRRIKNYLYNE